MLKIYLDMDDVLTAFSETVKALGAGSGLDMDALDEDRQRMYKAIEEAGEGFWAKMPWTKDGKDLWNFLKLYHPVLLSSPGKFRDAEPGKQTWVNRELPGVTLICDAEKYRYAERGSILIDDMKDNIEAWEEAGGTGILHTDASSTKEKLKELLKKPVIKMRTLAEEVKSISLKVGYGR